MKNLTASNNQLGKNSNTIKSKYFGQYQPQLYIASRSKSKEYNKKSTQKNNKQIINLNYPKKQTKNSHIQSSSKNQNFKWEYSDSLNPKKQKITLEKFLKNRKTHNINNQSACQKIFNWIEKMLMKASVVSNDCVNSANFKNQSCQSTQKIKKMTYNLFILKKAKKEENNDQFPFQLGMQSLKIEKKSKEDVIEQIQQLKNNNKRQQAKILEWTYLSKINQSQSQNFSSKVQHNLKQETFKNRFNSKDFKNSDQNQKQKQKTIFNQIDYNIMSEDILNEQAVQKKEIQKTSNTLNQLQPQKNIQDQNKITELKQNCQISIQQSFYHNSQFQAKNLVLKNYKNYKKETAICDWDHFFACIFSYQVKQVTLKELQPHILQAQNTQQQHENYQPFQHSHSQMIAIATQQNNFQTQTKKRKSIANEYISKNLIMTQQEKGYISKPKNQFKKQQLDLIQSNKNLISRNIQFKKEENFVLKEVQKVKPNFPFKNIFSKELQGDYQNQNKAIKTIKRQENCFYKAPLQQQDILINRFQNYKKQIEKSQYSSNKSSKPKVIFHYLSPENTQIQKNNREFKLQKKELMKQNLKKAHLPLKSMKNEQIIAENYFSQNTKIIRYSETQTQTINKNSQKLIKFPITKFKSQSEFDDSKKVIWQQPKKSVLFNQNLQYFSVNNTTKASNYVKVPINNRIISTKNALRQSQCANLISYNADNRFKESNQIPKKRARSLNEKLLVTCSKNLMI